MSSDSTATTTQPGWYPDPSGPGQLLRYWDGAVWTPHTHDPASPLPMSPPRGGRRPLGPGFAQLGRAVRILLRLCAVALGVSAVVHAWGVVMLGGWARDPATADLAAGRAYDMVDMATGAATVLALLGTAVTFLVWFHQAYTCDRIDAVRLREQPKWAVWGWIVPFIALVKPPRMTADLWHASAPVAPGEPVARTSPGPRIVAMWWMLWLGGGSLDRVSTQLGKGEEIGGLVAAVAVSFAGDLLLLGAALLLARVVRRISDNLLLPRQG
jgi:hypothetical protein